VLAVSVVSQVLSWLVAVVVAVATTFVGARLLGVRRGWLASLVAGAVGWVTALVIAAAMFDWDWDASSLIWVTIVLAIPLTMALMVGLDLYARPGTLARGDRAGLVQAPRPINGIKAKVAPFGRYRELLEILRRHHLIGKVRGEADEPVEDDAEPLPPAAVRLREALEEAGGVYVKLGQIAATRIDLLPPSVCEELGKLQSRSTPIPGDQVRTVVEAEYGRPVEEVFASFDWEPLAAASIGQTHTAVLRSGESVVVKVQRPDIRAGMERDLAALNQLARLAERRTVTGRDLRVSQLADEFGRSLRAELDFRGEAQATAAMHDLVVDDPIVTVPDVFDDLCARRVMVQERLRGVPLSELPADADVDRDALARALLAVNVDHILKRGLFHADPHPGNVMVLEDGTLGMIDFGATGRLDTIQQDAVVDMLIALVKRDASLLRDGVERVADVGAHVSRDKLDRALARLLADHVGAGGTVDVRALADLVPLLGEFEITLPGDLVVLLRALITLDGTLGVLSPGFSVIAAGKQLAQEAAAEQSSDPNDVMQEALISELPVLRRLPADVGRTLSLASRGSLQFRTVAAEDDERFTRTLWNRTLLAVVGSAFVLTSVLLMGLEVGPVLGGDTRLVVVLGVGGMLLGVVLLLRVVAAVVRDGTS
jgi:ubiquinone biosynthesis protein